MARNDSLSISSGKHGIISLAKKLNNSGKLCVFYVDEEAIGRHYGKELRKFLSKADVGECVIISKLNQMSGSEALLRQAELVFLSGMTVTLLDFNKETSKYVLLRPSVLSKALQCETIRSIIYPKIDRNHPLRNLDFSQICPSKIHAVPFNEDFETSWSKHINF